MSFWKSVNEDFSEIDTSGVGTDGNLNNLASFDLADIIGDEHSLTNTDYINNNYWENEEGKDVDQVTLSEMNIEASKSAAEVLKSSTPKGNDDQKYREDQSRMKEHVRSTHLRHMALFNVCGRRMFQDKLAKHEEDFHRQNSWLKLHPSIYHHVFIISDKYFRHGSQYLTEEMPWLPN